MLKKWQNDRLTSNKPDRRISIPVEYHFTQHKNFTKTGKEMLNNFYTIRK